MEGIKISSKKMDIETLLFSLLQNGKTKEGEGKGIESAFETLLAGMEQGAEGKTEEKKDEWMKLLQNLLEGMKKIEKEGGIPSADVDWLEKIREIAERIQKDAIHSVKDTKEKGNWLNQFLEKEDSKIKKIENMLIEHSSLWKTDTLMGSAQIENSSDKQETSQQQFVSGGNKQESVIKQEKEVMQLWKGLIDLQTVNKKGEGEQGLQEPSNESKTKEQVKTEMNTMLFQKTESSYTSSLVENQIKTALQDRISQSMNNFQMIKPEKMMLQLHPIDLGKVEITIEKINGEIHIKMKSENDDVQQILDGMAEEIKEEVKMRNSDEMMDTGTNDNQEEKTKEELIQTKNEEEEKEKDNSSFETELLQMLGGSENANNRYFK